MVVPRIACKPIACTSVIKPSSATNRLPEFLSPNSFACLTALIMSLPALASARTLASDDSANDNADENRPNPLEPLRT